MRFNCINIDKMVLIKSIYKLWGPCMLKVNVDESPIGQAIEHGPIKLMNTFIFIVIHILFLGEGFHLSSSQILISTYSW